MIQTTTNCGRSTDASTWDIGKGTTDLPTAIISHWYRLIENLQASPVDFYQRVSTALRDRQVPRLESSRVEWHEGGPLSPKRLYLRLARERLVFDICAAPFGKGFFVSWRLGELPLTINALGVLAMLVILGTLFWFVLAGFGICWGFTISVVGGLSIVWILRTAVARGLADLDAALLSMPVVGAIYERFFRPITYYRIDLALMYQQSVHAAVMQVIDELTTAQGIPLLSESERKPILSELYRR